MARASMVVTLMMLAVWPAWADFRGRVVGVAEGDAVTVRDVHRVKHTVRLRCADAPELDQAYGQASREHLAGLVSGKVVKVSENATGPDGHVTGDLRRGAIEVNLRMVNDGFAWDSPVDACGEPYAAAQSAAKTARRGLWQDNSPVPPWEFPGQ